MEKVIKEIAPGFVKQVTFEDIIKKAQPTKFSLEIEKKERPFCYELTEALFATSSTQLQ